MKVIDTVLPAPKTGLEVHRRWINRLASEANSAYGKKIEVKS